MKQFMAITVAEARQHLYNGAALVDTRDQNSFNAGHVPGSLALNQIGINQLIQQIAVTDPVMIICYHGYSSRQMAQYLLELGYESVYNVEGGFAAWAQSFPDQVEISS